MKLMSASGIADMRKRAEERLDQEILPAYYEAYDEKGDKEALAYPEEIAILNNMPGFAIDGDESTDEDARSQLDVTVHKAKDLIGADMGGTSDCFVRATVGDETFLTDTKKATVNPIWEKGLVFDVDPEERLKMSLILKIYDDDLDGDEFLGQCKVKLDTLERDGPPEQKWIKLTDEDGSHRSKEKRGEIFISLRFGEPVVGGAAETKADFLSCVPLAQIEGYYKTRVQINFYATKIQALYRGFLSRGGSGELMKQKSAEEMAQIKRIVNIQRKWRSKMMWRRIMSFKKAMTNGNVFMKVNASNGKISKRQIHCPGNMSTLYWREPGKEEDGNGMLVESMSAILVGRNTRTFQKCDQRTISQGGKVDKKLEGP